MLSFIFPHFITQVQIYAKDGSQLEDLALSIEDRLKFSDIIYRTYIDSKYKMVVSIESNPHFMGNR